MLKKCQIIWKNFFVQTFHTPHCTVYVYYIMYMVSLFHDDDLPNNKIKRDLFNENHSCDLQPLEKKINKMHMAHDIPM